MGVYIKGMEMPKSCYVCQFCDYVSARCDAVKGNPYTPEIRYEKRADFCPLVPVPPSGRLIDADEFYEALTMDDRVSIIEAIHVKSILSEVPTVIPAEPEEEEMK